MGANRFMTNFRGMLAHAPFVALIPRTGFVLAGGLGNQLFIIAAALAYQTVSRRGVALSDLEVRNVRQSRGNSLTQLDWKSLGSIPVLGRTNLIFRHLLTRAIGLAGFKLHYGSREIGFDPNLLELRGKLSIRGHFQTYKFLQIEGVSESLLGLAPKNPSRQFFDWMQEFQGNPVLSVHIRLGDYRNHRNSFGLLRPEYYKNAIFQALDSFEGSIKSIYVFSDEPEAAKTYLDNYDFPLPVTYVAEGSGLSDVEAMLIMAQSHALVIANSTYSWWSGVLGNREKLVIAPDKWFRNLPDPSELYPRTWLMAEAVWLDK